MPFIPKPDRLRIDSGDEPRSFGERCYKVYAELIRKWREDTRWTTAHTLYKELYGKTDDGAAKDLAWQVFFATEVMKYEKEKEKLNGGI